MESKCSKLMPKSQELNMDNVAVDRDSYQLVQEIIPEAEELLLALARLRQPPALLGVLNVPLAVSGIMESAYRHAQRRELGQTGEC